eukprot:scaffold242067_cov41-Prasinocladus_malaysianus.AAC.2
MAAIIHTAVILARPRRKLAARRENSRRYSYEYQYDKRTGCGLAYMFRTADVPPRQSART